MRTSPSLKQQTKTMLYISVPTTSYISLFLSNFYTVSLFFCKSMLQLTPKSIPIMYSIVNFSLLLPTTGLRPSFILFSSACHVILVWTLVSWWKYRGERNGGWGWIGNGSEERVVVVDGCTIHARAPYVIQNHLADKQGLHDYVIEVAVESQQYKS